MQDPLIGTWKLNADRSEFDPNHRPSAGTMVLELTPEGHYALTAEGVTETGEKCKERRTKLIPDGKEHPVPDFPGLVSIVTRPDLNTLAAEVRREDSLGRWWRYIRRLAGRTVTDRNEFRIRYTAPAVQTKDCVGSAVSRTVRPDGVPETFFAFRQDRRRGEVPGHPARRRRPAVAHRLADDGPSSPTITASVFTQTLEAAVPPGVL